MTIKKISAGAFAAVMCVILVVGCGEKDPKVKLLNSVVAEYGGEENLLKLGSYASRWKLVSPMRGEGVDTRFVVLPDNLRVELAYEGSAEVRLLSGDAGYKSFNGSPAQAAEGPQLDSMRLQLMRLYSPLELLERKDLLTLAEEEGQSILALVDGAVTAEYFVNTETMRIEKVLGKLSMMGREMEFLTEYSDFKVVEGVLIPHKEVKYAGGFNTATMTLDDIKLGEVPEASLFEVTGAPTGAPIGTPPAPPSPTKSGGEAVGPGPGEVGTKVTTH